MMQILELQKKKNAEPGRVVNYLIDECDCSPSMILFGKVHMKLPFSALQWGGTQML